jgi:hypothetical protein
VISPSCSLTLIVAAVSRQMSSTIFRSALS